MRTTRVPPAALLLILVVAALLGALGTGCAAARPAGPPTDRADGTDAGVRDMQLRNVFVLGPAPGNTLPAGGAAAIHLTLVNDGPEPDRLVSVAAPGIARAVQITGGPIVVPPGGAVQAGGHGRALVVEDLTTRLRGGEYVRVTFRFAGAGAVAVTAPVMPYAGFYATYPAPPSPAPSSPAAPAG